VIAFKNIDSWPPVPFAEPDSPSDVETGVKIACPAGSRGISDACKCADHISRRHFLILYLINLLPIDGRAKQIARVVVIILGVISLLKYIAVF
jgi:hypothetical protein